MTHSTPAFIPLWRHDFLIGYAIVDPEDFEGLKDLNWYLEKGLYACSKKGLMHRLIAGNPENQVVDHINGIRTDNRKSNLRVTSQALNTLNRRTRKKAKGVHFDKRDNIYCAEIGKDGIRYGLGRYETQKEAALAYDSAARQIHKDFAFLNYPDEIAFADVDWTKLAQGRWNETRRHLTLEIAREIRRKFSEGEKQARLAEYYDVNPGIINLIIKNKTYQERDEAETNKAIGMMQEGLNDLEITRRTKFKIWTVRAIREENKHLDFPQPKSVASWNRRISKEKQEEAARAFLGGRKGFEVAAEYEVSPQYLSHFVRAYKLKFPDWETSL